MALRDLYESDNSPRHWARVAGTRKSSINGRGASNVFRTLGFSAGWREGREGALRYINFGRALLGDDRVRCDRARWKIAASGRR